jgi:chromosome segregation ATPase
MDTDTKEKLGKVLYHVAGNQLEPTVHNIDLLYWLRNRVLTGEEVLDIVEDIKKMKSTEISDLKEYSDELDESYKELEKNYKELDRAYGDLKNQLLKISELENRLDKKSEEYDNLKGKYEKLEKMQKPNNRAIKNIERLIGNLDGTVINDIKKIIKENKA